jgi:hypothetical protein
MTAPLNLSGWLPNLIGPLDVQDDGTSVTRSAALNFIGLTVEDDPDNGRTNITAEPPEAEPAGSDTQCQWNNAGAFAGASGLLYHAGTNRPDMPNGWRATVSSQTATFAVTPTAARTITFQDATHTVVGRDTTDTLSNKTLTLPQINDASSDHQYVFAVSELAGDRTVTLPLLTGNDEFVFKDFAQTLTNKTLTSPTLTSPTITGSTGAAAAIGALDINWASANVFTKTLSAGGNVLTFSNSADGQVIIVILTGAASTVTWPSVEWPGGVAPTQTASGVDVYTFVKAGSTIYGSVVQAMS